MNFCNSPAANNICPDFTRDVYQLMLASIAFKVTSIPTTDLNADKKWCNVGIKHNITVAAYLYYYNEIEIMQ
ncbi:MAG TPA: hypothetical protein VFJ51_06035 [Nitrososphaeraceae archaeon]|nr:hypothetical protein [Nitrososphaeraceae archaeon]